jgi:cytochrome c oxidase subunit 2
MPSGIQSAVHAAGTQAARIENLWWVMFWVCTAVFIAVLFAVALAVRRGSSAGPDRPGESALVRGVATATGASIVILIALLIVSAATGRAIGSLSDPDPLVIQITGHQWWWQIEYAYREPSLRVTTANELHLPVGRPIMITLKSADVIHSFWIPNLHGKMDLIPGRQNFIWLQADRPGIYRGQCAEFCGLQHANMALTAVVEPSDDYERWIAGQRQPPPVPAASLSSSAVRAPCATPFAARRRALERDRT